MATQRSKSPKAVKLSTLGLEQPKKKFEAKEEGELTSTDISSSESSYVSSTDGLLDETLVAAPGKSGNSAEYMGNKLWESKEEGEITDSDTSAFQNSQVRQTGSILCSKGGVLDIEDDDGGLENQGGLNIKEEITEASTNLSSCSSEINATVVSVGNEANSVKKKRSWLKERMDKNKMYVTKDQTGFVDGNSNLKTFSELTYDTNDSISTRIELDPSSTERKKQVLSLSKKRKRNFSDLGDFTPKKLNPPHYLNDEIISPIDFALGDEKRTSCVERQEQTPVINTKFDFSFLQAKQILNSTPICGGEKKVRKSIFESIESDSEEGHTESENDKPTESCVKAIKHGYNAGSKEKKKVAKIFNPSYFCRKGRFTNVEANVSKMDVAHEEMTADILGLGKTLMGTDDSDSDSDETLVAVQSFEENKENVPKTEVIVEEMAANILRIENTESDDAESVNEKTWITISSIVEENHAKLDKEADTRDEKVSTTVEVEIGIKDTVIESTCTVKDIDSSLMIKSDGVATDSQEIDVIKDTDTIEATEKILEKSKQSVKSLESYKLDSKQCSDLGLLDTSHMRQEDINNIMTLVRNHWDSSGIPCQDTNLTTAMTFRQRNAAQGLECPDGYLEGEKLCCLNLKESEINNTCTGLKDLRLTEYNRRLNDFHKCQVKEMNQLYHRQNAQYQKLRCSRNLFPMAKQQQMMQMSHDHVMQRIQLQKEQRNDYDAFKTWLHDTVLQEHPVHLQGYQNQTPRYRDQGKYGPDKMVTLRKAPGKATNGRKTVVNVLLPEVIGQAVRLEDDIYDQLYSY